MQSIVTEDILKENKKYKYEVDKYGRFLFPSWILDLGLFDDSLYIYIEMLAKLINSSIKEGWIDNNHNAYIYYTKEELKKDLEKKDIIFKSEENFNKSLKILFNRNFIVADKSKLDKYYFVCI